MSGGSAKADGIWGGSSEPSQSANDGSRLLSDLLIRISECMIRDANDRKNMPSEVLQEIRGIAANITAMGSIAELSKKLSGISNVEDFLLNSDNLIDAAGASFRELPTDVRFVFDAVLHAADALRANGGAELTRWLISTYKYFRPGTSEVDRLSIADRIARMVSRSGITLLEESDYYKQLTTSESSSTPDVNTASS